MRFWVSTALAACAVFVSGCEPGSGSGDTPAIGVSFETLQTEYWVASFEAIERDLEARGVRMVQAIANGDANRQLEDIRNFLARGVDGIIVAPKDASTVIPMIKAANRAKVPMVLYNRPANDTEAESVAVVADNFALARDTVRYMAAVARQRGGRHQAMVLIGDLGDLNAINRRRGFDAAVKENEDGIEVVAEIPTEWNQETALAGATNALQAHPGINFIFVSSDFLLPSLVSALKAAGKYHRAGEPGHVILGGFDGDATAYQMLVDGYLDATGVQDVYYECARSVAAVLDLLAGKEVPPLIEDPGFVIHRDNLQEMKGRMWGAQVGAGAAPGAAGGAE
jgi:inositol transport system substrate-binding protein